jgi:voltage-gated potassium channel
MKSNNLKHAYFTGISLIIVIIIGTVGYYLLGFTPSEAIYQTIITMATVGFEEVHQLDDLLHQVHRGRSIYEYL